jgi:hypothetical protein
LICSCFKNPLQIDTFVRQVGPGELAVDIVFLLLEDFELDLFVP